MSSKRYLLVIDAGSSSVRTLVVDDSATIVGQGRAQVAWKHRNPGWAELDPIALWKATRQTILDAVIDSGIPVAQIAAATLKESDKNLPYGFYWTEYEVSVMVKKANKYREDLIKLHK
jgi:glycerol kinase